MEHALSLDTRLDKQDALPPDAPSRTQARLPSVAEHIAAQQTAGMPAEPLAPGAGDIPTLVTGQAARPAAPAARTALVTAGSASDSGSSVLEAELRATEITKTSHFTTVEEAELRRAQLQPAEEGLLQVWAKFIALALFVIVSMGGVWWLLQPPSADTVFRRIAQAAETGQGAQLAEREDDIRGFLERHPDDPRAAEVAAYQAEIERYRTQRRLELKARRSADLQSLSPVERAYLDAVRLANAQPDLALPKFQAVVELYGPASKSRSAEDERIVEQCVRLAKEQVERLQPLVDEAIAREQSAVRERLAEADELVSTDPEAARGIWRGVIALYGEKPWAGDFVRQAQACLAESTASVEEDN
jgi:serine/threonine-protein kinase